MPAGKRTAQPQWDVVIAGGGPAGLSAALILGRCGRRVLLCDRGTPRSWASKAMHGYLSRDGMPPGEFQESAHRELARYAGVRVRRCEVKAAVPTRYGFRVTLPRGEVTTRKLLIATGLTDLLPDIPGLAELYGTSVFQCPYCDGWEFRDRAVAIYGKRKRGLEMARAMTCWSSNLLLCTDGTSGYTAEQRQHLARNGVRLVETRLARLESRRQRLQALVFRDGTRIERDVLFFDTASVAQSDLTQKLGCRFTRSGGVACGKYEATSVPGVYVAGNIIRNVQLSIVAAAEGANAAFGINRALTREDFDWRATGVRRVVHPAPAEAGVRLKSSR